MNIERKTAAVLLAVTIGLTLVVGIAFAARPAPAQPVTILGFYDGMIWNYETSSGTLVPKTNIRADKPVKFTVNVVVWQFASPYSASIAAVGSPGYNLGVKSFDPADGNKQSFIATFGGYQMWIWRSSYNEPQGFNIAWQILVEGAADTVITIS